MPNVRSCGFDPVKDCTFKQPFSKEKRRRKKALLEKKYIIYLIELALFKIFI